MRRAHSPSDEAPLTWTPPSSTACAGVVLATRDEPLQPTRAFRNADDLWSAVSRDELTWSATVRCGGLVSTVGRLMFARCLPASHARRATTAVWDAASIDGVIKTIAIDLHVEIAARVAAAIEAFGTMVVARSGLSLAIDDFTLAPQRSASIAEATARVVEIAAMHDAGKITDGERYFAVIDTWSEARALERYALQTLASRHDALYVAAQATRDEAGRIGAIEQHSRGSGEILETPTRHAAREGRSPHEAMMAWMQLRTTVLREAEREAVARDLARDLHAVLDAVRVVEHDCFTQTGRRWAMWLHCAEDLAANDVALIGRVLAVDVHDREGTLVAAAGTLIHRRLAASLSALRLPSVIVRDPIACASRDGVCARCVGLDPDDHTWLQIGDAIGARAAERVARESTSFARRVFHVC